MVSVGSVDVTVVPNAERFNETLAAQLNPAAARAGDEWARTFAEAVRARLAADHPDVSLGVDTTKADAEVDAFLLDTKAKTDAASRDIGDSAGRNLTDSMRQSAMGGSPLIAAAVAGGLALGAPAVAAGAVAMFGGVAAVLDSSNTQFKAFASDWGGVMKATFQDSASVTIPAFESAIQRVGIAIGDMAPNLHALFASLNEPIGLLTTGLLGMVQNLMPGLIRMMQNAGPVFQGISIMLQDIGTGLGKMFDLISQHGTAGGQVFAALGAVIQNLLPIIGQLVSAGAELAAQVLPGVASTLGLVANVLDRIAPVLPGVLAAFLAFKGVSLLSGPLDTFSAKLQTIAADSEGFALKLSGGAASAVSGLSSALPILGVALGAVGFAFEQEQQKVDAWAKAILAGGDATDQFTRKIDTQVSAIGGTGGDAWQRFTNTWDNLVAHIKGYNGVADEAAQKSKQMYDAMSPLQQRQQDVTKATNDLQTAVAKYGAESPQAAAASVALAAAQRNLTQAQAETAAATNGTSVSIEVNNQRLQGMANTASAANTAINLLKAGLDALTGKAITMDQAEIAVTQAMQAATQAAQGNTAALVFTNGQLDLSNEKSAQAAQLLIALAGVQHQEIATMEQQGATTDQVNQKTDALRQEFIRQAQQLGATAEQAQALADRYFGIPGQVHTEVTADTSQADGALDGVQAKINAIMQNRVAQLTLNPAGTNTAGQMAANADGGYISGPGGPRDDAIPSWLSNGEYVINAASVAKYGTGLFDAINAGYFRDGGMVTGSDHLVATLNNQAMMQALQQLANMQAAEASAIAGAGGAAQWANVALQALAMEGQSSSWLGLLLQRMNQESGGNQYAINLWDSNAAAGDPSRGLMQTIGSTFNAYHDPRTSWDIYDPLANIAAAIRYTLARYGDLSAWGQPGGYALGTNWVPNDGLAYLHKGEAVVPASQNAGGGAPWKQPTVVGSVYNGPVIVQDPDELGRQQAKSTRRALVTYGVSV